MQFYAQTILQLLQQLERLEYSQADQVYIHNAYKFVITKMVGHYRPCGKTAIAHLIGTASILASLKTSKEVIVAGLLQTTKLAEQSLTYIHNQQQSLRSLISRVRWKSKQIARLLWSGALR